ncbi:MAG TPA: hypothetical protein VFD41_02700 [Actinomycetales bacterium]|nr:hypothetical protein [Actinomycetales bacterium]
MGDALRDGMSSVATFVPKFLAFIVILVVGWLIAKAIAKGVDKLLERVGFDRAVERGGIKKALDKSKYDASTIVSKLVYYALLLFVLQLAFGVWGPNPISELLTNVIAFLPRIIVAIVIVVVAAAIAAAVRELISNTLAGLSYGRVLATIASVFILGIGVIAALNQVGIATTVTTPVLITVLATIGGIMVVGVGGGLIKPMQHRWERYLATAEAESGNIREQVAAAPSVKEQAHEARERHSPSTMPATPAAGTPAAEAPTSSTRDEPGDLTQPYDQTVGTEGTRGTRGTGGTTAP